MSIARAAGVKGVSLLARSEPEGDAPYDTSAACGMVTRIFYIFRCQIRPSRLPLVYDRFEWLKLNFASCVVTRFSYLFVWKLARPYLLSLFDRGATVLLQYDATKGL